MQKALNIIDTNNVLKKIDEINIIEEKIYASLNNMNALINDLIAADIGILDSDFANQYKSAWEGLYSEIPDFLDVFKKEAANINTLIQSYNINK